MPPDFSFCSGFLSFGMFGRLSFGSFVVRIVYRSDRSSFGPFVVHRSDRSASQAAG